MKRLATTHLALLVPLLVLLSSDSQATGLPLACTHPESMTGDALLQLCSPCVTAVCEFDPFCCGIKTSAPNPMWDSICVQDAAEVCNVGGPVDPCSHDVCEEGAPLAESCDAPCIATVCGADPICCSDVWDDLCVDQAVDLCVRTCDGGGPPPVSCSHSVCEEGPALDASCSPCAASICAVDSFCCSGEWDDLCVGAVETTCGPSACDESSCSHSECSIGEALTESCSRCAAVVCAADSFCCTNSWDGLCVGAAETLCGGVCDGGGGPPPPDPCTHSECVEGIALVASCSACATTVCNADSYCCGTAWDRICVDEAEDLCAPVCGP